jgi:hypothetical protein
VVFAFVMLKVTVVIPFSGMLAEGLNVLLMVGGATTVSVAVLLAVPVPPSVEVIAPVVLSLAPAVVPCTSTLKVHDAAWLTTPLDRLIKDDPATAVTDPLQVLLTLGVGATTSPAGRLSVNATPLRVTLLFGLLMMKLTEVVPFRGIVVAPNALLIVGGLATVRVAVLLVAPVPPLVELTAPVVLGILFPDCVPVTFTTIVQLAPGVVTLPPDRLIVVVLAAAVTVPPQVLLTPGVLATCNPLVSVSLNATPNSAVVLAAGLVMVKVTVVVPFSGTLVAPNALVMVGGATTVMGAVLLVVPVPPCVEVMAPVVLSALPAAVPFTSTLSVHEAL